MGSAYRSCQPLHSTDTHRHRTNTRRRLVRFGPLVYDSLARWRLLQAWRISDGNFTARRSSVCASVAGRRWRSKSGQQLWTDNSDTERDDGEGAESDALAVWRWSSSDGSWHDEYVHVDCESARRWVVELVCEEFSIFSNLISRQKTCVI